MPESLVSVRPRLPRTVLRSAERDPAYQAARRDLEAAARQARVWVAIKTGRATPEQRRVVLAILTRRAEVEADRLTRRLLEGRLRRDVWERQVRAVLVPGHYAAALAGAGKTVLSPDELSRVQSTIREQTGFLKRWRGRLASGESAFDGTALNTARLYGSALWATGQAAERQASVSAGKRFERATLTARENCRSCLERTGGKRVGSWVKLGTLLPIGAGLCLTNCKCFLEFK